MSDVILAVGGCRDYNDYNHFETQMSDYIEYLKTMGLEVTKFRVGDAPGVDSMVLDYALKYGIDCDIEFADWDGPLGKAAGMVRNESVLQPASHFLAFWDGKSVGTGGAINLAIKMRKCIVRKTIQVTDGVRYYSDAMKKARNIWKSRYYVPKENAFRSIRFETGHILFTYADGQVVKECYV